MAITIEPATAEVRATSKIDFVFNFLQVICFICGGLQLVIDPTGDGILCNILVVGAITLVLQYVRITRSPIHHPLSTIALLGLCGTAEFMSLVAQTVYWNPLQYLLRVPTFTFAVLSSVMTLAVAAHYVFTHVVAFQTARSFVAERILLPLGAFSVPSVRVVWFMAVLGSFSLLAGGVSESGNVGGKFFEAMNFMAYLPYMIPLYYLSFGERYCSLKKQLPFIVLYAGLIVVVGMVKNQRQIMLIGPIQAVLIYFLYYVQDTSRPAGRNALKKTFVLLVVAAMGILAVADLATAMAISRGKRRTASPSEMISETVALMGDRARLDLYRQAELDATRLRNYDEAYIPNSVLARFSETKFHDNMLYLTTQFSEAAREDLKDVILDRVTILLPQNILGKFQINLQKDRYRFSMGDYYLMIHAQDGALGWYATGSIWADIINVCEWWSPLVVFVLMIVSFFFIDIYARSRAGILAISPALLCASWNLFLYGLGGDSLAYRVEFLARGLPQRVVLFIAAYWVFALFSRMATKVDGVSVHMGPSRDEPGFR